MNTRKTVLATAIVAALSGQSAVVMAADGDEQVEKLEKIQVTGSRISRVDVEGATPLTVITREDIEDSGLMTVADVLQSSTYNSFGSYSAVGNNAWGSQATVDLRGVGASNTLVLIDGKRIPWSGVLYGGIVDVNSIPAAAVDRIEIMPDGASAIYGSDAVAGVINIILRKDFDGLEVSVGGSRPSTEGADEDSYSLVWGVNGEKGNLIAIYEHDETENIGQKDRSYTSAGNLDAQYTQDTTNLSATARTVYLEGEWVWKPIAGSCTDDEGRGFYGPYDDRDYPGDRVCKYDYTLTADLAPEITRDNINVIGTYELSDEIQFSGGMSFGSRHAINKAAAIPGFFEVDGETVGGRAIFDANGWEDVATGTAQFEYRFNQLGPRTYDISSYDLSGHATLNGSHEFDFVDDFSWDLTYSQTRSNYTSNNKNMLAKNNIERLANDNADFFLANGDINEQYLTDLRHTWVEDTKVRDRNVTGGIGFSAGELSGGSVGYYFGASYLNYTLNKEYDPQSATGDIGGVYGGVYSGKRTIKAVFGEMLLPFTDQFELNLALRHDRYSDFGTTTNPKAAVRYQPADNLVFRSSIGTSFKAPNFSQLYTPSSTGYYEQTDYTACAENGVSFGSCEVEKDSMKVTSEGNSDLKAEKSKMFTFGAVYEPIDELTLKFDYFNLQTDDLIQQISAGYYIQQEALNGRGSESRVTRLGNGTLDEVVVHTTNIKERKISGIDLSADYDLDLADAGKMDFNLSTTYTLNYEYANETQYEISDHIGFNGLPQYKINATVGYTTPSDTHRVSLSAYHTASQSESATTRYNDDGSVASITEEGHVASNTRFTISYRVNLPWDGVFSAGVRNLFDRGPSFYDEVKYSAELYGVSGRTVYANYTQTF